MDLVESVAKVVKVAIKIKEQVDTVKQNKEDCRKVAGRVEILRAIVECLENTAVGSEQTIIIALNELEETFLRTLKLVKACQTNNIVCLFVTAGNVSKQLRGLKDEMMDHMHIANFANGVQQTGMLGRGYTKDLAAKPKKLLKVPTKQAEQEIHGAGSRFVCQDTSYIDDIVEEVEDTDASYSADVARSEIHGPEESFPAGSLADTTSGFRNFSLSELKALTNNFSDQHVIGRGGFAIVYKGVLSNGAEVAIKSFMQHVARRREDPTATYFNLFSVIREHENVIKFLGYCHEMKIQMLPFEGKYVAAESHHMAVVEEYMPNGSLSEIIDELDWPSAFRIIRGIAQGVAHIHTRGVVHLDVKPANILLDYEMNPKICDFELSKILNQEDEDVIESVAGTVGYMPLEYMADRILSSKHDVYSFGITVLHTISKSGLQQDSSGWIRDALEGESDVDSLLSRTSHEASVQKEIKRCMDIGLQCAAKDRTDRPTMRVVIDMLDGKIQPRRIPVVNKASSFKKKGRTIPELQTSGVRKPYNQGRPYIFLGHTAMSTKGPLDVNI